MTRYRLGRLHLSATAYRSSGPPSLSAYGFGRSTGWGRGRARKGNCELWGVSGRALGRVWWLLGWRR